MVVSATHNTESRDRYSMIESRANICIDIDAEGGQGSRDILMSASEACSQGKGKGEDEEYSGDGGGSGLVVIAATNRLEDIDPAVVRRFESRVYVGVPDHDTRVSMLISFLR